MEGRRYKIIVFAFAASLSLLPYLTVPSSQRLLQNMKPVLPNDPPKIIYSWDQAQAADYQQYLMNFTGCKYSNCVLQSSDTFSDALYADAVIVDFSTDERIDLIQEFVKQNSSAQTVWLVYGQESPGYSKNKWRNLFNDFDGSITYKRDALVYHPYGQASLRTTKLEKKIDYAANKTRGAFAYVTNCGRTCYKCYNRLSTMKKLGEYIDVDIFGGCTGTIPCPRGDWTCEHRLHSHYHFYISFENSLCKDYITEKFWKVLNGDGYYIPVALGGLTLEDYTAVAPPNSFLHAYNFTTIEQIGRYMKELTEDHQAFNQYNHWRNTYRIELSDKLNNCKLCKIANFPSKFKTKNSNIDNKFNDPKTCRGT